MALSTLEKIKVLRYLGWPAKTLDATTLSYSKILSDRLDNLGEFVESEVRFYLERFEKLDDKLDTSLGRAGVKRIDDIELNSDDEMRLLRKERFRLGRELALLLDIKYNQSAFGSSQGGIIV